MTIMSFLLLVILFLAFFIYFSGLNPQDVTIHFLPDHEITYSVAIVVVAAVLLGLLLGYLAHMYGVIVHGFKHWKDERQEKKTKDIQAIYREGVGRLLSGDVKKAHTLLQKALDRDSKRVDTRIAMANVLLQEGKGEEALEHLRKAKEIEPRSLEVLFKQATTFEEMNREEDAIQGYQEILAIEANNRKALRCLRDLHMKEGRWPEALDLQKRVLKVGPGSNRLEEEKEKQLCLSYEVARLQIEAGKADAAIPELKDIIKQSGDFVPAYVSLGDAFRSLDRGEDAVKFWKEGYQKLGKSVFLSRLEDYYMDIEDPATLLTYYRATINDRKNDLLLRLFYGKLCLRLEMVEEALEQLYAVDHAGVDSRQVHLLLAEAHRRRDRIDESISEYQKALGVGDRIQLEYVCEACGTRVPDWRSRCSDCGVWGKINLIDRQSSQDARLVELKPIHHGQREEWDQE